MGQTESHYTQPPSTIWLKVQYVVSQGPYKGMHKTEEVGSTLDLVWFIMEMAKSEHRQYMKDNNISIQVGDLFDYTPTDFLSSLRQSHLKGILNGVYIEGLRIEGERFAIGVTDAEKAKWWVAVQSTISYLGLKFRQDAGIYVEPLQAQSHLVHKDWVPVDRTYLQY